MKIESITARELRMRLRAPFETSSSITQDRRVLLIEVRSDTRQRSPMRNRFTISRSVEMGVFEVKEEIRHNLMREDARLLV